MIEYGLFNDESADYTADEAVEAGFSSPEDAQRAIDERYSPEDELIIHQIEEPEEDEGDEEDEDDEE